MQNRSRYESLNVSLQTDTPRPNRNRSSLNKTIDITDDHREPDPSSSLPTINKQSPPSSNLICHQAPVPRDKLFQQLYRKNEQLRRELKIISMKLSDKIDRLKFVPKRETSTPAPTDKAQKALRRQLENAYKQIMMYKKQIQVLKAKEETEASFEKFRELENTITFKDNEIGQLQSQLRSIKTIKSMQQKKLDVDVHNEEIQDIVKSYAQELKELKDKLKQFAKRDRKREENYKKQQAYLYEVEKKLREVNQVYHPGLKKEEAEKPQFARKDEKGGKEISLEEWNQLKEELNREKETYKGLSKKVQALTKAIKKVKTEREQYDQKNSTKQNQIASIKKKLESLKKLLRETPVPKETSENDLTVKDQRPLASPSKQISQKPTPRPPPLDLKPKQWQTQSRIERRGHQQPNDRLLSDQQIAQQNPSALCRIIGINLSLDDDNQICGFRINYSLDGSQHFGLWFGAEPTDATQLKWQAKNGDYVKGISGAFSARGSLEYLVLLSKHGKTGRFGNVSSGQKQFSMDISEKEFPRFILCATRTFGTDVRIVMIGASIVADT